ncbi:hypothetical protein ACFQZE_07245 [Paenibacillus sp. GCM10027627]|uniref:ADP-ribosyltransferase-containing protein n=1 Tax=unclassified Paenibacillus TaxID=185978 RepID=UPI0036415A37
MENQTFKRNEVEAMKTQYDKVLAWEVEFAQQIEELKKLDNSIIVYHGTHNSNVQFNNDRTVTNYNTIGTWFTSTPEAAKIYGSHVMTKQITINNPLHAHTDDFDNFFLCFPLALKYIGKTNPNKTEMTKLLLDSGYMTEWKQMIANAGYDTIVFKNSRIDLDSSDNFTHTVYIVLDTNKIQ